ncbi:hypothetical protein [Clostridium tagluense]|uniref:Uncharacterized protein n=1 Tax=Clostridium tagluense TaxID=360422 RepID=A0A401ULW0_9CLOT|nr:hypothetical protein [Clostridium tagluense]GCD10523.1 hypothetical protein Ctaglu_21460 [Clostridium tagluense]
MNKSKKKSNIPRHKRLDRASRLLAAEHWIPKYEGENIIKGYSKHFAVDKICAINELQMLGYKINPDYVNQLNGTLEGQKKVKEQQRQLQKEKKIAETYSNSDDTFYYIAGYTSGGASYGISWEECEIDKYETEEDFSSQDIILYTSEDDDIPF